MPAEERKVVCITGSERHLVTAASEGTSVGMAVSEYLVWRS